MHEADGRVVPVSNRLNPQSAFEDRIGIIQNGVDRVRCIAIARQMKRRRALP